MQIVVSPSLPHIPSVSTSGTTANKPTTGVICFRCKQAGHYIRNCPQLISVDNTYRDNRNNKYNKSDRSYNNTNRLVGPGNKKQQRRAARSARIKSTLSKAKTTTEALVEEEVIDNNNKIIDEVGRARNRNSQQQPH